MHLFSTTLSVCGVENVPRSGPLLVLANHPGMTDAIALMAALPTLLVYILLGRFFLRGLLAGSLKG